MSAQAKPLEAIKLTKAEFVSDQTVRWCPGCGDYSILANVQKIMPEIGVPRENVVFISGIGCSSRFPYYMNTYGFHTIHGRAPALASGLKLTRPELSIWMVTGDGDGLSIGGNHLIHILRRNININIMLFNNRIYGLTKGQYSPTSEQGKITKSTPTGSVDAPLNPLKMALAAEATFVGRALDIDPSGLQSVLKAAAAHKGISFVEIYQNCNIFNDGAFDYLSDRAVREDKIIYLEHGKPMIFGKAKNMGIRLNGITPEVVTLGQDYSEKDLLVHDAYAENASHALLLSTLDYPHFPVPMGVIRQIQRPTYEDMLTKKLEQSIATKGLGDLTKLLNAGNVWEVSLTPNTAKELAEHNEAETEELQDRMAPAVEQVGLSRNLMEHKVRQLQPPKALVATKQDSLESVIQRMKEANVGSTLVQENQKLLGIFTEGDILKKIVGKVDDLKKATVGEHMTLNPACVDIEDKIAIAFNKLAVGNYHHLPVLEQGKPIGVISSRGLLAYINGNLELN